MAVLFNLAIQFSTWHSQLIIPSIYPKLCVTATICERSPYGVGSQCGVGNCSCATPFSSFGLCCSKGLMVFILHNLSRPCQLWALIFFTICFLHVAALTSTSTRTTIYKAFAIGENIGDVTTKGECVGNVVDLLCLLNSSFYFCSMIYN